MSINNNTTMYKTKNRGNITRSPRKQLIKSKLVKSHLLQKKSSLVKFGILSHQKLTWDRRSTIDKFIYAEIIFSKNMSNPKVHS